ncbi:MAG: hypothetical protein H6767_03975 [Candidatus Peribacteria bacterium]|nr:MAG: hypothetical protein H6767_03975 [Candidatus Peribacteria bacterium]
MVDEPSARVTTSSGIAAVKAPRVIPAKLSPQVPVLRFPERQSQPKGTQYEAVPFTPFTGLRTINALSELAPFARFCKY